MTEFEKYFGNILDGKIIVCDKIKESQKILIEQFLNPGEFHFDLDIANRHIEFIERFCKQPTGKLGRPLKLELFLAESEIPGYLWICR